MELNTRYTWKYKFESFYLLQLFENFTVVNYYNHIKISLYKLLDSY